MNPKAIYPYLTIGVDGFYTYIVANKISGYLFMQAKQLAHEQNVTLRSVVEKGLVKTRQKRSQRSAQAIQALVFGGNGLRDRNLETHRGKRFEMLPTKTMAHDRR